MAILAEENTKLHYRHKIGRCHSDYMQQFFYVEPTGPDLGNIDIKEINNRAQMVTIKPKDFEKGIDYWLVYSHITQTFYLYNLHSRMAMKPRTKRGGVKEIHFMINAVWDSKDEMEMMNKVEKVIKEKRYCKWREEYQQWLQKH
jgi:hypothetical protein